MNEISVNGEHLKIGPMDFAACINGILLSSDIPDPEKVKMVGVLAGSAMFFIRTMCLPKASKEEEPVIEQLVSDIETIGLEVGSGRITPERFRRLWDGIREGQE